MSHHFFECAGCSDGADSMFAYVVCIGPVAGAVPPSPAAAVRVASERICLRVFVRRGGGFQFGFLKGRGRGVMSSSSRTVFVWGVAAGGAILFWRMFFSRSLLWGGGGGGGGGERPLKSARRSLDVWRLVRFLV